jgi:hypothetical protein
VSIPSLIRQTVAGLALFLGALAFTVFAADIVFDDTPICADGSVLKQITNCETGPNHPLIRR